MKIIFQAETELGRCDADRVNGHFGDDLGDWMAFAYTTAAQTGRMLRIEQQCYLRSILRPDDVRDQTWVKPSMSLEPSLSVMDETVQMVQHLHGQFVQDARDKITEQGILVIPASLAEP